MASPSPKKAALQDREGLVAYDPDASAEEMPDFQSSVAGFMRRGSAATVLRKSGGASLMSVTGHANDSLLKDHLAS